MSISAEESLRILNRIWGAAATFDERAALEFFLLDILQTQGSEGVGDLLRGFPDGSLGAVATSVAGSNVRFTITRDESPGLLIDTFADSDMATVNVEVEAPPPSTAEIDPRHAAFYAVWESFVQSEPPPRGHANEGERAVFLVGLLEAEVMNGGFGQYLTNTDGAHLEDTLSCLERVRATKTRELLVTAVELGTHADSFVAAWDEKSEEYSRLDTEFLAAGEDLAALTADEFLSW